MTPDTQELIEALEPCPFCAHAAAFEKQQFCHPPKHWVKCTYCGATTTAFSNRESAAKAWNTRARSADEQRYRHKVRGTEYAMLGEAEVQSNHAIHEGAKLVVYRGDDNKIWTRPVVEFYDGRFEPIEAASARISAGDKDRENPVERPGNGEQPTPPDDLVEVAKSAIRNYAAELDGYAAAVLYNRDDLIAQAVLQALAPHLSGERERRRPIMLEMAEADEEHQKWLHRLKPLRRIYREDRPPNFVDQSGAWTLREFIEYAAKSMGEPGDHLTKEGR